MRVTVPLDIALLVVDYAHPRRLDESALEHLQRLTRLALVCKAFHRLVRRTLETTVRIWAESLGMAVVWDRLREAEQRGRPVETLVAGKLEYSMGRVFPESSTSLKKIVLVAPARVQLPSRVFSKELYPALSSLSLGARLFASHPPRPPTPLALTELLLTSPDVVIIRDFCNPSATPLLRHLCLLALDFPSTSSPTVLSDVELFRRLGALEISYQQTPPTRAATAFAPNFPVLTLLRTDITDFSDLACPDECVDSGVAYIQLQYAGRFSFDTPAPHDDATLDLICATFHRLVHRIERGLRPKVLFLPDNLHPDVTPVRDFGLGEMRDLFFATLEQHGDPHISWYRADEETDASPSEPFRRYLDRERLAGRV